MLKTNNEFDFELEDNDHGIVTTSSPFLRRRAITRRKSKGPSTPIDRAARLSLPPTISPEFTFSYISLK